MERQRCTICGKNLNRNPLSLLSIDLANDFHLMVHLQGWIAKVRDYLDTQIDAQAAELLADLKALQGQAVYPRNKG